MFVFARMEDGVQGTVASGEWRVRVKTGRLGLHSPLATRHSPLATLLTAADPIDLDGDHIARARVKVVRRHDAGAGQQHHAGRGKLVFAAQPRHQSSNERCIAASVVEPWKNDGPAARDGQADAAALPAEQAAGQGDGGPEGNSCRR